MKYSIDKNDKYTIIALAEEKIDTLKTPILKSEFINLYQSGVKNLIIDLSKVKYMDSSGLSAILMVNRMSKDLSGFLVLTAIQEHIMKLITISKLDSVLNILPTTVEAIDAVFLHEIEKDIDRNNNIS